MCIYIYIYIYMKYIRNIEGRGGWGGAGVGGGHVGRGGGCFTLDFCRFPLDLGGFLARGFTCIFLLSTRHFQKTSPSELGSFSFYFRVYIFLISLKMHVNPW